MYKSKSVFMIFMIMAAIICAAACSSDSAGTAVVKINTGLGKSVNEITKAPAPSNIGTISIIVTGASGAEMIRQTFSPNGTSLDTTLSSSASYDPAGIITLTLDPGPDITFTVVAEVNPADPGVFSEWTGSATQDIAQGDNSVTVEMALTGTRIIIPDCMLNRIVRIDDMSGSGWGARSIPLDIAFNPYDIDIDNMGRIYIANNESTDYNDQPILLRIDNFNSSSYDTLVGLANPYPGVIALALDNINNYVYYCYSNNSLCRKIIEPLGSEEMIDLFGAGFSELDLSGVSVGSDGLVYIANGIGDPIIAAYDPSAGSLVYIPGVVGISNASDILVKDSYVYVADAAKVVRLNLDLTSPVDLLENPDNPSDVFLGPHRFLATLNRKIYVIDEKENDGPAGNNINERIVAFDDITGAGWETYKNSSSPFGFYSIC